VRNEKECVCSVSVVRFKFRCNILISGKIIKEMPGSVASGTSYIFSIARVKIVFVLNIPL